MSELATMGIGNKPCLDIKPSSDNIQDRFINIAGGSREGRKNHYTLCFQYYPFPKQAWFLRLCSTSILKTLWEKEKLLATSKFLLFPRFLPFWKTVCHFHQLELLSANSFSLEESKIGHLRKG